MSVVFKDIALTLACQSRMQPSGASARSMGLSSPDNVTARAQSDEILVGLPKSSQPVLNVQVQDSDAMRVEILASGSCCTIAFDIRHNHHKKSLGNPAKHTTYHLRQDQNDYRAGLTRGNLLRKGGIRIWLPVHSLSAHKCDIPLLVQAQPKYTQLLSSTESARSVAAAS